MTERKTALLDGTAPPIDEDALRRVFAIEGMPEDRLTEGLVLDQDGRPIELPYTLREASWTTDFRTGRLLSLSIGAASIFGHPITELRSRPSLMFDAIHVDDRWVLLDLAKLPSSGGAFSREFRVVSDRAGTRWIRAEVHLIAGETGERRLVEGILLDVTEERRRRQEMENLLELWVNAESDLRKYKVLADQSSQGVAISEDERFTYVNAALAGMLGYEREDLLDQPVATILAEREQSAMVDILRDVSAEIGRPGVELWHRRRDESEFLALVHSVLVEDPDTGRSFVASTFTDVTMHHDTETILKAERRRLESVLDSLPGMVFRIRNEENWPVEYISHGSIELTGWRPEDLIESRVVAHIDCVHPDDRGMVWEAMQMALTIRDKYEVEYRIIDASGRTKWVMEQGIGVYAHGECVAMEGFVTDITDRIEAVQAASDKETRYRELVNNMKTGVIVFRIGEPDGSFIIQEINKAAEEIEGVCSSELLGRNVLDCIDGVADSGLTEVLERVAASGVPEHLPRSVFEHGALISSRDQYVYRLPSHEVVLVFEDLTEKRQAERARDIKQMSIDQANDAMIWTIPDGSLIDANERACELYGATRDELLSRSIFDLTMTYTMATWKQRWDELRSTRSSTHESCHQRFDGALFPVEISTKYLESSGQEYHCTVIRDLTETKRTESEIRQMNERLEDRVEARTHELKESQRQLLEAEKMAALGRLVAGVTHEINTPMGLGVTAASHLRDVVHRIGESYRAGSMKRSDFEESLVLFEETTDIVLSNLDKATRLIQGFKGVAVDQSDDARRIFDLKEYLEETLLSLRPRLRRSSVDVTIDCIENVMVDSYPGALSQIISNLVFNALTHAFGEDQPGRISIIASTNGKEIRLSVRDDGRGMAADVLDKIYEPFFTTRRGQGGSGLGMHVVYTAVIEMLAGRINCESAPGQGTIFTIHFPQIRETDDE